MGPHSGEPRAQSNASLGGANELANQSFDVDRYGYHIVVETPDSVPTYTEEIPEIVQSGITLSETEGFDKFRSLMEGMIDEQ